MSTRSARSAALYLRLLVAWLLAMQPMIGAYAAASAAASPISFELCSGASVSDASDPAAPAKDHGTCCLAACMAGAAPPPGSPVLAVPHTASPADKPLAFSGQATEPAGLGPQSARAPPL